MRTITLGPSAGFLALVLAVSGCLHGDVRGVSLDPDEFIATAQLPDDLRLELAAGASPPSGWTSDVSCWIGPGGRRLRRQGRMFVVEMGGYPPRQRPERIAAARPRQAELVDADRDGGTTKRERSRRTRGLPPWMKLRPCQAPVLARDRRAGWRPTRRRSACRGDAARLARRRRPDAGQSGTAACSDRTARRRPPRSAAEATLSPFARAPRRRRGGRRACAPACSSPGAPPSVPRSGGLATEHRHQRASNPAEW